MFLEFIVWQLIREHIVIRYQIIKIIKVRNKPVVELN
jgi:hypothetical protein